MAPLSEEPRKSGRPLAAPFPSVCDEELIVLEKDVKISQSLIWRLQRDFYAQRGLKAWSEDMVPQFITNNPFIAEIYARVVFAFLRDCLRLGKATPQFPSSQNPLRILELGAGPGKFAFLFLRHLATHLKSIDLPPETVRYCMTDCSETLISAWQENRWLLRFVEKNILQFEKLELDGTAINSPFLSGPCSDGSESFRGPLVVIAHYVFDSLPFDAFVVKNGQLHERLQTTGRRTSSAAPQSLSKLNFSYQNVDRSRDGYVDDSWNKIVESYRCQLTDASVLFPSHVLNVLRSIGEFTDGPFLVMASDKGYVLQEDMPRSEAAPVFEFHSANCFSQMVNFDAIAKYFAASGGLTLLPDKRSSRLKLCGFLQPKSGVEFGATIESYEEVRSGFGPDDLFVLLEGLNPHLEEMSVPQILALLRLSRWDPTTFLRVFPVLARQIRGAFLERNDLRAAIERTWANHFPITPSDNSLAFYCGVTLLELQFFEEAASMLKQSQDMLGRSAATSYNLGLCSLGLGRSAEALTLMIEACDLDPSFEAARQLRKKLETSE
jgi:tetratricopeptide (TPR) repeat protein